MKFEALCNRVKSCEIEELDKSVSSPLESENVNTTREPDLALVIFVAQGCIMIPTKKTHNHAPSESVLVSHDSPQSSPKHIVMCFDLFWCHDSPHMFFVGFAIIAVNLRLPILDFFCEV